MDWTTLVEWTGLPVRFKPTRAQFQTITDALKVLGGVDLTAPGWINSIYTWVYVSAASFKIVGVDATALFTLGMPVSCTDGGSTKFFNVRGRSYAGGDTTVAITGGTDYTLSGGAITSPRFSFIANPYGFPGFFNHSPAYAGWAATPTRACWFSILASRNMLYEYDITGTSNANNATLTMPITSTAIGRSKPAVAFDNTAWNVNSDAYIAASSTTLYLSLNGSTTGWTTSGTKTVRGQIVIPI